MNKKQILVIDDEERIREIYVRLFRAIGTTVFDVFQAQDAEEATEILIKNEIDLVLLDIKMSGVDGTEMYDIIKEYDPNCKVIVASVYPIDQQRQMIPQARDYHDKSQGPIKLLEKATNTLVI